LRDTETLHRIDPETVEAQATATGFECEASSDVLRNFADPHTVKVFDPSIRRSAGTPTNSCSGFACCAINIADAAP
jgi:predicted methyltransferase